MRDIAAEYGWVPAGARPHVLIPVRAPEFVAACAAAVAAWRHHDWGQWLRLLDDDHLHITLAWADRPCDTLTEADRAALREAGQDHVGDVDPFQLLLGQAREVTYGIELDVDPAADAQIADLAARCRRAVGAVLGLDAVPMPDRWTYPHVALGYGRRTGPSDGLAGWLAHARTTAGARPQRVRWPVTDVVLVDADTFALGGPLWSRPVTIRLGRGTWR